MCELKYRVSGNRVAQAFWIATYMSVGLTALKTMGVLNWSWWYVAMPLWVVPVTFFVMCVALIAAVIIGTCVNVIYRNIAEIIKR